MATAKNEDVTPAKEEEHTAPVQEERVELAEPVAEKHEKKEAAKAHAPEKVKKDYMELEFENLASHNKMIQHNNIRVVLHISPESPMETRMDLPFIADGIKAHFMK